MIKQLKRPRSAIWRGIRRQCPLCQRGRLFIHRFTFPERCPHCDYKFERFEGSFTGSWMLNFAVTEIVLFVELIGFIIWYANHRQQSWTPLLWFAIATSVVVPVVSFPFSKTIWAACESIFIPPTDAEIAVARARLDPASDLPSPL